MLCRTPAVIKEYLSWPFVPAAGSLAGFNPSRFVCLVRHLPVKYHYLFRRQRPRLRSPILHERQPQSSGSRAESIRENRKTISRSAPASGGLIVPAVKTTGRESPVTSAPPGTCSAVSRPFRSRGCPLNSTG